MNKKIISNIQTLEIETKPGALFQTVFRKIRDGYESVSEDKKAALALMRKHHKQGSCYGASYLFITKGRFEPLSEDYWIDVTRYQTEHEKDFENNDEYMSQKILAEDERKGFRSRPVRVVPDKTFRDSIETAEIRKRPSLISEELYSPRLCDLSQVIDSYIINFTGNKQTDPHGFAVNIVSNGASCSFEILDLNIMEVYSFPSREEYEYAIFSIYTLLKKSVPGAITHIEIIRYPKIDTLSHDQLGADKIPISIS
jgi:hypothetical protein